jgi:hypothetical protein
MSLSRQEDERRLRGLRYHRQLGHQGGVLHYGSEWGSGDLVSTKGFAQSFGTVSYPIFLEDSVDLDVLTCFTRPQQLGG